MKINKKILSLSAVIGTTAIAPLAAVSCGAKKSEVIFAVTFSQGKEQWNALQGLIDYYNTNIVDKERAEAQKVLDNKESKKEDKEKAELTLKRVRRVTLKNVGSGYNEGPKYLVTKISNNDKLETPNITVGYGTSIAQLSKWGRAVDVSDQEKWGDLAIKKDVFEPLFLKVNDSIAGLPAGKLYELPLMKSTNAYGINGPVYKYVLSSLRNAGITIDNDIVKQFNLDNDTWNSDVEVIKKDSHFGAPKSNEEILKKFDNFHVKDGKPSITEGIFENFIDLVDFVTRAIQCFTASSTDKSSVALLGIDDPIGFIEPLLYSSDVVQYNDGKMPMTVGKSSSGDIKVTFGQIENTEDETTKLQKDIYEKIMTAVKLGAIKIYGGGSYSSADETNHKLGGNFGSTAGFSHNFITSDKVFPYVAFKVGDENYQLKAADGEFGTFVKKDNSYSIVAKYNNSLLAPGADGGKHNYVAVDQATFDKLKDITDSSALLRVDANSKVDAAIAKLGSEVVKIGNFVQGQDKNKKTYTFYYSTQIKLTTEEKEKSGKKYTVIANKNTGTFGKLTWTFPTSSETLQPSELIVKPVPRKYKEDQTLSASLSQGPNLMMVKDTDEDMNYATIKFIKFMTSQQEYDLVRKTGKKDEQGNDETEEIKATPFEYIATVGSYVVPFKDFWNTPSFTKFTTEPKTDNPKEPFNRYLALAFDTYKKAALAYNEGSSKTFTLYDEPASVDSDKYRSTFNTAYKSLANQLRIDKNETVNFDNLVGSLSATIKLFDK